MLTQIKLEAIGSDLNETLKFYTNMYNEILPGLGYAAIGSVPKRYWCAEITGFDAVYKYSRFFLKGKFDYTHSNSKGSRGVYVFFLLNENKIYEVSEPKSWKNTDRYFCKINNCGDVIKLSKQEVDKWLKSH